MKIFLNREYLEGVTNEHLDLLETEDMQYQKERIQGMINYKIHFCSLVTGYRGTGKSTFVDYVLDGFGESEKKNILVVKINAIYYKRYEVFVKRFIRELFFQYGGVDGAPYALTELYYHTFYEIKKSAIDSSKEEIGNKEERVSSKEIKVLSENDWNKVKNSILKYTLGICLVFVGANIGNDVFSKFVVFVLIVILIIMIILDIKLYFTWKKERTNINIKEDNERSEKIVSIESLYDDEIAEYHLFNQLKEAKASDKKVVFVLDELDKIEERKDIDRIFHDLKPLFLSSSCDFILVGGKDLECYLQEKLKEDDAIVKSIFSNKIYIPLSTIGDMRDFALKFYDKETTNVEDDGCVWKYFDNKIYESKGIKRCFVNALLADLRWEEDKPYIDIAIESYDKEQEKIIEVYESVEKYINENYGGQLRDSFILLLYRLLDKLLTRKQEKISLDSLVNEEFEIRSSKDITVEEIETLCQQLLNQMLCLELMKEESGTYEWYFNVVNDDSRSDEVAKTNFNEDNFKSLDQFMNFVENMLNIMHSFAKIQGRRISKNKNNLEEYNFLFDTNVEMQEEWSKARFYFEKAHEEGIGEEDMPFIRLFNEAMRMKKATYLVQFLKSTYKYFFDAKIIESTVSRINRIYNDIDIVCKIDNPKVMLFTEVKYFREHSQAISTRELSHIKSLVDRWLANEKETTEMVLKVVVFTNGISEKRYENYKNKCSKMLQDTGLSDVAKIYLVDLSNYEQFSTEMRNVLEL